MGSAPEEDWPPMYVAFEFTALEGDRLDFDNVPEIAKAKCAYWKWYRADRWRLTFDLDRLRDDAPIPHVIEVLASCGIPHWRTRDCSLWYVHPERHVPFVLRPDDVLALTSLHAAFCGSFGRLRPREAKVLLGHFGLEAEATLGGDEWEAWWRIGKPLRKCPLDERGREVYGRSIGREVGDATLLMYLGGAGEAGSELLIKGGRCLLEAFGDTRPKRIDLFSVYYASAQGNVELGPEDLGVLGRLGAQVTFVLIGSSAEDEAYQTANLIHFMTRLQAVGYDDRGLTN